MNNKAQILSEISNDLNIGQYKEENFILYKSRVIYSALSKWIKISTLDKDILKDKEYDIGQSSKYLVNKAKEILENIIEVFPEINIWFHPKGMKESPEILIIDRLKNSGEIIKSGFRTQLALPTYEECIISDNTKVTRGIENNEMHVYTGLVQLKSLDNICKIDKTGLFEFYGLEDKTAQEIWYKYIKNAEWKKRKSITCNIFNKYSKFNFYRSWEENYNLKDGEISIYKENYNDYGVIKNIDGEIYTSQFTRPLVESYEIRRFMYALKCEVKNNTIANYKYIGKYDAVELNLRSALPNHENNILLALGWPKNSIQDTNNLIFNIHVWEFVKLILENLNIVTREID
ncbi:Uncharacterised protein [[Clostridium] sordellii]|uniref:hypothetical protein n=1 Tax=Paraclostridium sordellii TaxID=1505 RepID=UPI0005DB5CBC|nr:hypothetical protein [Paeniclostridium sordellii]CEP95572.1 Uncharacterised protein [[Clostridium] sordellii] [Paeniclostridium sordellii]